jgi:hypothetical protein
MLAGPIALAAAMVIYVTTQRGPSLPELPEYSVTATGDAGKLRVGTGKDARFELLLRPATAPRSKVVAYAFILSPGAEPAPLEARVEIAPDGLIRLKGQARVLGDAPEIRVVVGAPEAIGKFDDALDRAQTGQSDARVRVLSVAIERADGQNF